MGEIVGVSGGNSEKRSRVRVVRVMGTTSTHPHSRPARGTFWRGENDSDNPHPGGFQAARLHRRRVEVYIPAVKRHRDLFDIGDILGIYPRDRAVLQAQCASDGHIADRLKCVQARPELT